MPIFIVDAHNQYQNGLNIPQVAKEGYRGLIVKATQGSTGYTAPAMFDTWIQQARQAEMVVGAYHWLTNASVNQQLDHYLDRIASVGGADGMLCAVDVEDTGSNAPSWGVLRDFVARFNSLTGGHPLLVYSGNWWWSRLGWKLPVGNTYLWDSRYVDGDGFGSQLYGRVPESWWKPRYGLWNTTTLLQFTSEASVAGQKVDVSAFRGTIDELRALTRPSTGGSGGEGDDMSGETADFAAANVPVPGQDGAVCGSQVALGTIWSEVEALARKVDAISAPVVFTDSDRAQLAKQIIAEVLSCLTGAIDEVLKP